MDREKNGPADLTTHGDGSFFNGAEVIRSSKNLHIKEVFVVKGSGRHWMGSDYYDKGKTHAAVKVKFVGLGQS